jgi:hypothetical protein
MLLMGLMIPTVGQVVLGMGLDIDWPGHNTLTA